MIQSKLKDPNIVELYDYTENEEEIVLLMEYCNDAGYFEDKLENVSRIFQSQIYPNFLLSSFEFNGSNFAGD